MVIVAAALLLPFTSTFAAKSAPAISLSPSVGPAGTPVTVAGSGLPARTRVQLTWDNSTAGLPTASVTGRGTFKVTITVPAAVDGAHILAATATVQKNANTAQAGGTLASTVFTLASGASATATPAPVATPVPAPTTATNAPTLTPTPAPPSAGPSASPAPTPTVPQIQAPTPTPTPTPSSMVTPTPTPNPTSAPTPTPTSTPAPAAAAGSIAFGAYVSGFPSTPSVLDTFDAMAGRPASIVMYYQNWTGQWNAFCDWCADAALTRGGQPLVTWEPWVSAHSIAGRVPDLLEKL